ncbi:hypothetical protein O181_008648 [Austropuccinia psidii MF-1]|uniref:DUF427 domain-containing protein n=1 Tax=Austropuccinia psidii MF-1 TaxID=1389203 RepID=A0A9Q3BPJ5_9BASI|nr:hypothetical protein [Austropuccinia psidii MF-1]
MSTSDTQRKRPPESVWDYPRPPALVSTTSRIRILLQVDGSSDNELVIADTQNALRVLETSHPPTYYIPAKDVNTSALKCNPKTSFCEWKGIAEYYDLKHPTSSSTLEAVAWTYRNPNAKYEKLANYIAFYAMKPLRCFVDDEQVVAQEGNFYGGWKTSEISGGERGIKGGPGTLGW